MVITRRIPEETALAFVEMVESQRGFIGFMTGGGDEVILVSGNTRDTHFVDSAGKKVTNTAVRPGVRSDQKRVLAVLERPFHYRPGCFELAVDKQADVRLVQNTGQVNPLPGRVRLMRTGCMVLSFAVDLEIPSVAPTATDLQRETRALRIADNGWQSG